MFLQGLSLIFGFLNANPFSLWAETPPAPNMIPYRQHIGPHVYQDPFHWMRVPMGESPSLALQNYVEAENQYSSHWFEHQTAELQSQLKAEFHAQHFDLLNYAAPKWVKNHKYEISDNQIYQDEEVFFDPRHFYLSSQTPALFDFQVSEDQLMAVVGLKLNHQPHFFVFNKKLNTLTELKLNGKNEDFSFEWIGNQHHFFYVLNSLQANQGRIFLADADHLESQHRLVLESKDAHSYLKLSKTTDQEYFIMSEISYSHREDYLVSAHQPFSKPFLLVAKGRHRFTYVDHLPGHFVVRSNFRGDFYDISELKDQTKEKSLQLKILGSLNSDIESFMPYQGFFLIVRKSEDANQKIEVYDSTHFKLIQTLTQKDFKTDEAYFSLQLFPDERQEGKTAYVVKTGIFHPETVYSYRPDQGLIKVKEVKLSGIQTEQYTSRRLFFSSTDGTQVPMTLIYRQDLDLSRPHPVVYSAYGCYGSLYDMNYDQGYHLNSAKSLMDRGIMIAIAHVRGGGDLGLRWYLQGKFPYRWNVVNDFISGAEYLIRENFAEKGKIAITGYSAGGALVGRALTLRPDLWASALIHMGYTDYIGSELESDIPYSSLEQELHGDPSQPKQFKLMKSLSPQDTIRAQEYPPVMVRAAYDDSNVMFTEGTKFVAKLRTSFKRKNPVLLRVLAAGQGDHDGPYENPEESVAEFNSFLLWSFH